MKPKPKQNPRCWKQIEDKMSENIYDPRLLALMFDPPYCNPFICFFFLKILLRYLNYSLSNYTDQVIKCFHLYVYIFPLQHDSHYLKQNFNTRLLSIAVYSQVVYKHIMAQAIVLVNLLPTTLGIGVTATESDFSFSMCKMERKKSVIFIPQLNVVRTW